MQETTFAKFKTAFSDGARTVPLIAQATSAVAVTESDSTVLTPCALYIGTGGDLVVDMVDGGTDITFKNVPDGTMMAIQVVKVKAATTAADILALR